MTGCGECESRKITLNAERRTMTSKDKMTRNSNASVCKALGRVRYAGDDTFRADQEPGIWMFLNHGRSDAERQSLFTRCRHRSESLAPRAVGAAATGALDQSFPAKRDLLCRGRDLLSILTQAAACEISNADAYFSGLYHIRDRSPRLTPNYEWYSTLPTGTTADAVTVSNRLEDDWLWSICMVLNNVRTQIRFGTALTDW